MPYLTLMNVIVSKAHPRMSNRKDASHFTAYMVNRFIVNSNSVTS